MKKIVLSIIMIMLLAGCEKFLDVTPDDKAYEEQLFTDRSGFESALAGVYTTLNQDSLYGRELKFGFMESLVGSYNVTNSAHTYYRSFRFEYNYEESKNRIDAIWGGLYTVINQSNIILKNLDNISGDPYYPMIKGEALGLRAFAHLQLLKLFGPVISQEGANALAIPYKDAVTYTVVKFSTAAQVMEKLNRDLAEARTLLEDDPLRTSSRTDNLNQFDYERYNSLVDYRGTRMNYFAVVAMQAMVAQWAGDLESANKYAEEIISEVNQVGNIKLATLNDLTSEANRRMPMENIFALFSQDILKGVIPVFPLINSTVSSSTNPFLFPNYSWLNTNLYTASSTYGSTNDFRFVNWFGRESTAPWKLQKYLFDQSYEWTVDNYKPLFENKVISLHTLYMIAAEYYATANPQKAIEYLNKVRNARDLSSNIPDDANMTTTALKNLIFAEMRKENIGEGTLFTEYKRLFRAIDRPTPVEPSVAIFRLPVPDDELLYNPQ